MAQTATLVYINVRHAQIAERDTQLPRNIFRIKGMYEKYGPVVRATPEELHINDPEWILELYPVGGRWRDRYRHAMELFDSWDAAIAIVGVSQTEVIVLR